MKYDRERFKSLCSELRHRITVKRVARTKDGEGGYTSSLVTRGAYWAAVYPISESQVWEKRTINVDATHIVVVRGEADLRENDRVIFGAKNLEVLTVADVQSRGILRRCACKEVRS